MRRVMSPFAAIVVAVILTATVSVSQAWDRQQQFTFRTPDGGFVQHNDSSSSHLLGSDTWQSTQTYTPVSNVKRTRETETESKSWTRMNLDPKCNNEKAPLTDKWFAQRERNLYEDQGSEVVGANSGGNPSLLNVLLPAAFSGSVAATSGGAFYYAGQKARKAAKIAVTQNGNTQNGGGATVGDVTAKTAPVTATTGPSYSASGATSGSASFSGSVGRDGSVAGSVPVSGATGVNAGP